MSGNVPLTADLEKQRGNIKKPQTPKKKPSVMISPICIGSPGETQPYGPFGRCAKLSADNCQKFQSEHNHDVTDLMDKITVNLITNIAQKEHFDW